MLTSVFFFCLYQQQKVGKETKQGDGMNANNKRAVEDDMRDISFNKRGEMPRHGSFMDINSALFAQFFQEMKLVFPFPLALPISFSPE